MSELLIDKDIFNNACENLMEHNKAPFTKIAFLINSGIRNILYTSGVGCGKSYVTKALLNCFPEERILYIVPKNSIAEYLYKESKFSEYEERIDFITYNYFSDETKNNEFIKSHRIIIADESHHIGSDLFGMMFREVMKNKDQIVLGLTATPLRDDEINVSDYFEETVCGITNFEAIRKGLMPRFEYIICTPDIDKQTAKLEKLKVKIDYDSSDAFLKAIVKDNPRDKWICFYPSIKALEDGEALIMETFPGYEIVKIHSDAKDVVKLIEKVRNASKCVVMSCDMLLEGLHLDNVSGICLMRNVQSLTVFQQILGRTCQIGKKETPFIIDCTETAYKMWKKLLKEDTVKGTGTTFSDKNESSHDILQVSLCNKTYYDITKILMNLADAGKKSFVFEGQIFSSIPACCRYFDVNYSSARTRVLNLNESYEVAIRYCIDNPEEKIVINGKEYNRILDACEDLNVDKSKVYYRKSKYKESSKEAILRCIEAQSKSSIYEITYKGKKYASQNECMLAYNVASSTAELYMSKGHSFEEAMEHCLTLSKPKEFKYKGNVYKTFKDACKFYNLDYKLANLHKTKKNLSEAEALDYMLSKPANPYEFVFRNKTYKSLKECCKAYGITIGSFNSMKRRYKINDNVKAMEKAISLKAV